ncbi:response regulator [Halomicrobium mukohataei]|uniref:Response regulator n=1 Tax=Halomicrobium mukohataei TaxID=57705 RepID=A0A847UII0_9EURY|nr:response regulator [Halomicrobium mukohataei]NLV10888.1 response regulator [Halomicrobium mukohataei]
MCGDWDTVLVVDDDPACRELHSIWLDDEYEVLTAADGRAALDKVGDADVMLLDREMPQMNGAEVAQRLTERPDDCFVVMISGVEPDFDVRELIVDDYLTKPVSRETVLDVVETMLSRGACRQLLREYFSLTARKATLELRISRDALGDSDEYHDLIAELEATRTTLDDRLEQFDGHWRQAILAAVTDDLGSEPRSVT